MPQTSHDSLEESLLDQCGVAVMAARITSRGLVITACNEANAKLTGYSRAELIGARPDDTTLSAETDMQSMHRAMRSAKAGEPGLFASRFRRKDGTPFAVRCLVTGQFDDGGKLTHYVFVSTPINPGSPELRWFGSNGLLAQAERIGGTGAWRYDFATEELICSDNCYALFGLAADESMTARLMELLPEAELDKIRKVGKQCRQDGQPGEVDITFYRDDGSRREALVALQPECNAKGEVVALVGVVRDESEMRCLRRRQKMFLNAARIGFIEVDLAKHMISFSADTAAIIGMEPVPGRMSVQMWKDRVHPEDIGDAWKSFCTHAKTTDSLVRRYRFRTDAGDWRWVEVRAAARMDPGQKTPIVYSTIADIDDQVRAGQKLADMRARLDFAVEAAELGLWSWDLREGMQNGAMSWSPHMRRILGLEADDEASWSVFESLLHPQDRGTVSETILAAAADSPDGGGFALEHRCIRPDGVTVWVENRGLARRDHQGRITAIAGALLDITERKRAEARLVRSEQRFHDVMAMTGECIFELDADGRFTYLSSAAQQIYGYEPQEMLGETPLKFTPYHQKTYQEWIGSARENLGWHNVEREVRRKDGSLGWITVKGRAVMDEHGNITGFRGAITDTTERHGFIEKLLESERRTNDAVRIAESCIFDLDPDGRMTYVSNNARQLFGAGPEELIGQMTHVLAPELKPRHVEWLEAIRNADGGLESEIRMTPLDGRPPLWMRTICRVLTNDAGELIGYRGFAIDITARKQADMEIIKAKREAEAAAEERARFLSTMSHEIRTPLNAMIGMTDLLLDMDQPPEQKALTSSANTAGKHLLGLVNDILDFSKLDAGKLAIENTPFDLEDELNTVRDMMAESAREKGLALELSIAAKARGCFSGDPQRLRQILVNLVGNAIKFTERGRVGISVSAVKRGWLRFAVTDTGTGIAEEALPALFQDFAQADSSITRKYGGTGLGLAISKRLAERMGGTIGVHSTLGEGSTFWFELPLKRARKSRRKSGRTGAKTAKAPENWHLRVLVAEDNPANQMLIRTLLTRLGHEVVIVNNGHEAVQAVQAARYDLILMDVQMPELDGVSATRQLRDEGCTVPVIALTAHAVAEEQERFAAAGMNDWLSKPFDARKLAQTMYGLTCTAPAASAQRQRRKA